MGLHRIGGFSKNTFLKTSNPMPYVNEWLRAGASIAAQINAMPSTLHNLTRNAYRDQLIEDDVLKLSLIHV